VSFRLLSPREGLSFGEADSTSGQRQLLAPMLPTEAESRWPEMGEFPSHAVDASFMRKLAVDPRIVADQLGHSVDVNLSVYSKAGLGLRKEAVETLESALHVM
jgi:hypothetical protein